MLKDERGGHINRTPYSRTNPMNNNQPEVLNLTEVANLITLTFAEREKVNRGTAADCPRQLSEREGQDDADAEAGKEAKTSAI